MAIGAPVVTGIEFTGNGLHVYGTIPTPTGNYSTAGDTVSFAGIDQIKASGLPFRINIWSNKAGQTNLFIYNYAAGTSLANGKVQVFSGAAAQTGLTELSAGAYPAGVLADTLQFEIIYLTRNS
jgi:hypothetical protein